MARLSPLQRKLKLKNPSASAKQKRSQAQVDIEIVTLPVGKHLNLELENLSHDGRGVGRWEGKTIFVEGGLKGESVKAEVLSDHKTHAEARLLELKQPSDQRVTPFCPVYDTCGGCQLQHLEPSAQVSYKQAAIAEQLRRLANIEPQQWAQPIVGENLGYRRRAQLATRYFADSKTLLLGFRQSGHKHIVPITHCPVLEPALSDLLVPLHDVLVTMAHTQWVTHVEVLQANSGPCISLKVSDALIMDDQLLLAAFAKQYSVSLVCQQTDHDDLWLSGTKDGLSYSVSVAGIDKSIELDFAVQDFVQVNAKVNQGMINQAIEWLEPCAGDQVLDLFSGVGNFSLPIASMADQHVTVLALEGDYAMVKQGRENARRNGFALVDFEHADLFETSARKQWQRKSFNKALLDPPRAGAKGIAQMLKGQPLERVVYVSCNPASMARDLKEFQSLGLHVDKVGCIDMFPHTPHLEVMALLVRTNVKRT
ncbi:23S rRNA (uracil(1939)-C(5))-methyltransferase RlmD [Oceanospirillaceae bacterium]|jgi:23S rRNA (uracil1939-C5)-methyltransferase|uniref:23S rRNA (uracil(1939)-C(5))-methyltransferase RlmD n=1 Tax=Candidatus Njordibacter sp. Uisw_002 TaxID=3230971 RepID=UPI0023356F16|nr:23S rRNA (uracil(1939)-C(5))-methyltransferase RlmD [Oceanospirillaceae bacterium]MDB9957734.1 23S rRNA (uracil(1939)-C(5))-methyltransferase RlmD [Oceanospirillaceae bacterium]|tara:strand:+ start:10046 stop:11488 length:1443 start_codon:yes stop_codon:yes gene_type:complete